MYQVHLCCPARKRTGEEPVRQEVESWKQDRSFRALFVILEENTTLFPVLPIARLSICLVRTQNGICREEGRLFSHAEPACVHAVGTSK